MLTFRGNQLKIVCIANDGPCAKYRNREFSSLSDQKCSLLSAEECDCEDSLLSSKFSLPGLPFLTFEDGLQLLVVCPCSLRFIEDLSIDEFETYRAAFCKRIWGKLVFRTSQSPFVLTWHAHLYARFSYSCTESCCSPCLRRFQIQVCFHILWLEAGMPSAHL